MKILVAISSCARFEENHQSMRDTWLPEAKRLGMDHLFFVEAGGISKGDIVVTQNEDWAMTCRLKYKVGWALSQGYDYVFSCFPDTYVRPDRLLTCGFEKFDYFGSVYRHASEGATFYCHGGAGYMLSRAAMAVVIKQESSYLNDDCWLGDMLTGTHTTRGHCEDFHQFAGSPLRDNTAVTSHLSYISNCLGVPYEAKFMYAEHKQWQDSGGVLITDLPPLQGRALRWKRRP